MKQKNKAVLTTGDIPQIVLGVMMKLKEKGLVANYDVDPESQKHKAVHITPMNDEKVHPAMKVPNLLRLTRKESKARVKMEVIEPPTNDQIAVLFCKIAACIDVMAQARCEEVETMRQINGYIQNHGINREQIIYCIAKGMAIYETEARVWFSRHKGSFDMKALNRNEKE